MNELIEQAGRQEGRGAGGRGRLLVVLGMHRSGTSALAGTFSQLGFNLGDELIPATADANPKGYFEHAQVVQVHDHLLAALGMDWQDPRPLPEGWRAHPVAREAAARLRTLIGELVADGATAVLKDPRMCRFLPLWLELLDDLGVETHFAFIARHPVEVAASLRRRDDMSEYRAGMLTLAHQLEAEEATRGRSRVFLTYEALVADWRTQLQHCYRAFGLGPVPLSGPAADKVDGFLDAGLRHHRAGTVHALDPRAVELYEVVASAGADEARLVPAFAAVRASFEADRRAYVASMDAVHSALRLEQRRQAEGGQGLAGSWGAVPVDEHLQLRPVLYVRAADGEYSQGATFKGEVSPPRHGRYEARFQVRAGLPLARLRFDPDERPGVYAVHGLAVDGRPVEDFIARVLAFNGQRAQLHGDFQWASAGDDPWIEFDLAGLEPSGGGPVEVVVRFSRVTAHAQTGEALSRTAAVLDQSLLAHASHLDRQIAALGGRVDSQLAALVARGESLQSALELKTRHLANLLAEASAQAGSNQTAMEARTQHLVNLLDSQARTLAAQGVMLQSMLATLDELKARSDRPLLHRVRGWWQRSFRGGARGADALAWSGQLAPLANLEAAGDGWRATSADPQLSLWPAGAGAVLRAGWYRLRLQAVVRDGLLLNPCLYPDLGGGISEGERIALPEFDQGGWLDTYFYLPADARALRLDPSCQALEFSLRADLRPVGRARALAGMARSVWQAQGRESGGRGRLLASAVRNLLAGGPRRLRKHIHERYVAQHRRLGSEYAVWLQLHEPRLDAAERAARVAALADGPRFSVVMPVYQAPLPWLRRAIESVQAQSYPHWELCISDDASPSPAVREVLAEYARADARIKVHYRERNGHISESSNSAIELASGDFMALLDHDDELHPDALLYMAEAIAANSGVQLLYSDEDKIDENGVRFDPYFKSDFNYELLLGQNCISHLGVYALPLVREVGGFRKGMEGSQDWDLALRCVERLRPEQIHHVPRVLYHWRAILGSTALGVDQKNYAILAGQRAVQEHLERTGQAARVEVSPYSMLSLRRELPAPAPMVSLIIPTRDRVDLLRMCIDSILQRSTYPDYEILVVDNGSVEVQTLEYFASLADEPRVRVLPYPGEFNYSAINNHAARQARGQVLGLVNNDIEVITPGWMEEMVAHAMRPEVGAVGAMLYYPDDTIQHAGVLIGVGGVAAHIGSRMVRGAHGYFGRLTLVQRLSAVTAACLLVRREVFEEVGGLDEGLKVAFNDVDFCLRLDQRGYRNIWTPHAELYHHESASRGLEDNPVKLARFHSEVEFMQRRWGRALTRDPAYNPNLSLRVPFALGEPGQAR